MCTLAGQHAARLLAHPGIGEFLGTSLYFDKHSAHIRADLSEVVPAATFRLRAACSLDLTISATAVAMRTRPTTDPTTIPAMRPGVYHEAGAGFVAVGEGTAWVVTG